MGFLRHLYRPEDKRPVGQGLIVLRPHPSIPADEAERSMPPDLVGWRGRMSGAEQMLLLNGMIPASAEPSGVFEPSDDGAVEVVWITCARPIHVEFLGGMVDGMCREFWVPAGRVDEDEGTPVRLNLLSPETGVRSVYQMREKPDSGASRFFAQFEGEILA